MATSVTTTGTFKTPAGTAETGTVRFVLTHALSDASGNIIATTEPVDATITAGAISQALYANDDTTTTPTGTAYDVYHKNDNHDFRLIKRVIIPYTAPSGTIDLADLEDTTPTANVAYASQAALNAHAHGVPAFMKSGMYYAPGLVQSTITPTYELMYTVPFYVPRATAINQLAVNITAGVTSGAFRLGVYDDNGYGYPGALRVDGGALDVSSTGDKTSSVTATLQPGFAWFALVAQTTNPSSTCRSVSTGAYYLGGETIPSGNSLSYTEAGVSGALPANFTSTVTSVTAAPRVWFRVV